VQLQNRSPRYPFTTTGRTGGSEVIQGFDYDYDYDYEYEYEHEHEHEHEHGTVSSDGLSLR